MRPTSRRAWNAFVTSIAITAMTAQAFAQTVHVQLEQQMHVRKKVDTLLTVEAVLPKGSIVEVSLDAFRKAETMTFLNDEERLQAAFVRGVKVLSAPGQSVAALRILNSAGGDDGLYMSKKYLAKAVVVKRNGATDQTVELREPAPVLINAEINVGPANPSPRDKSASAAADCRAPMATYRTRMTYYFAARHASQHRRVEGARWVGNRSNRLKACTEVAADQRFYPYGTELYIPSLVGIKCKERDGRVVTSNGIVRVADTGGAIKGRGRFDFFHGLCDRVNTRTNTCADYQSDFARVLSRVRREGVKVCVRRLGNGRKSTGASSRAPARS